MNGSVHRQTRKAWAQRILPLCLCGFAGASLLAAMPQAGAQSNDVLNRLKRIENDVDTLNRAVYKGEKPPALSSGSGDANAELQSRLNQVETDLRNLTGKVEEQTYATQQIQKQLDALEAQMQSQSQAAALPPPGVPAPMQDTNTIPPMAADGTPAVLAPDEGAAADEAANVTGNEGTTLEATDAASLYEQGFAQIKREDYPGAEKTFADFMKKYSKHALAPNALYWLGETYYVRKDYDKAARTFAEAYQKFPGGPKGADNLLKLGLSLAGKGEKDNACIALGQLRKEYPKGPEPVLKRGEQEMATLGCK